MVLIDSMEHAYQAPPGDFAQARVSEICVGSCAAILVSAMATLALALATLPEVPASRSLFCRRAARWHALQAALALALIPWVWSCFHLQALSQRSITIMTVMMVPMADLTTSANLASASTRLRHRFLGGGIGGLLATAIVLASHAAPVIMTLAGCLLRRAARPPH